MTTQTKAFLEKLAQLLDEYKASLSYATDDDGIHVEIGDDEVTIGWPTSGADILAYVSDV